MAGLVRVSSNDSRHPQLNPRPRLVGKTSDAGSKRSNDSITRLSRTGLNSGPKAVLKTRALQTLSRPPMASKSRTAFGVRRLQRRSFCAAVFVQFRRAEVVVVVGQEYFGRPTGKYRLTHFPGAPKVSPSPLRKGRGRGEGPTGELVSRPESAARVAGPPLTLDPTPHPMGRGKLAGLRPSSIKARDSGKGHSNLFHWKQRGT